MKTAYYNGKVYTGKLPLQSAFLEEDGCFRRTGSDSEILALSGPGDRKVDLEGCFVCAGFIDSHMHLLNFGQFLLNARLAEHTQSLQELLSCLKEFLHKQQPRQGHWLTGRGWNQDYFSDEKRMPDRYDLDRVSTEVPIMITRTCGHCCIVNSTALKAAGIDRNTPDPEGGAIGRYANGEPDGRLYEKAIELLDAAKPQPDKADVREMLLLAMAEVNRYGITSVQTDDYSTFRSVPWQLINEVYRELEAEGLMTVRVTEQCNFEDLTEFRHFVESGNFTGNGSEFFRIGPLKLLGDGSLGSRTAHLSMPYLNSNGEQGMSIFDPEYLKEIISYAHDHDMQIAVHAIGDACLDEVLDAYDSALKKNPRTDHRHGIVHCQIARKDQLERIARMKLHVYAQSIFLDYDNHIVEKLVPAVLSESSYSWKTLINKGVCVSNGSDCPVELPNVMAGIECAVTRSSLDGYGPFLPMEAFSIQEALDSFTSSGAKASFEENRKGCIQEGMLADFVILRQNPFETKPSELHKTAVAGVFLAGKEIFQEK